MRKIILLCGFMALSLSACSRGNTNNTNSTNITNNQNTAQKSTPNTATERDSTKAKADFTTPKAAVETFIKAAASRDAETLSKCFDADSPKEFQKFRDKTASQKDLDELADFVQDAIITGIEESGNAAEVGVKFKDRNEQIALKKTSGNWKIVDF